MERLRKSGPSIAEMRRCTALVKQGRATLTRRREMLAAHRAPRTARSSIGVTFQRMHNRIDMPDPFWRAAKLLNKGGTAPR